MLKGCVKLMLGTAFFGNSREGLFYDEPGGVGGEDDWTRVGGGGDYFQIADVDVLCVVQPEALSGENAPHC